MSQCSRIKLALFKKHEINKNVYSVIRHIFYCVNKGYKNYKKPWLGATTQTMKKEKKNEENGRNTQMTEREKY